MRAAREAGHQLPRRRPLQRRDRRRHRSRPATPRSSSASCSAPSGWVRDEVVVANKLWWEFWPEQTAADELGGSLGRMGLDHIDLIYATPPPATIPNVRCARSSSRPPGSSRRAWLASGRWRCGRRRSSARHSTSPPSSARRRRSRTSWRAASCSTPSADDPAMVELMANRGVGLVAVVRARRRHADRQVPRRRGTAGRATTTLRRTAPANRSPSRSPSWRASGE